MRLEQPKSESREGAVAPKPHSLLFDPFADSRITSYDLNAQPPLSGNEPPLSFSIPEIRSLDDLSMVGHRRENDLYQDWLAANSAMDRIANRVAAANRDFISPLSFNFLGMDCEFIVCKIPHTTCAISPFAGGCSF